MKKKIKNRKKEIERHRQILKYRTLIRTQKKKITNSENNEERANNFSQLKSFLDKAKNKKIIHKNRVNKMKKKYSK